MRRLISAGLAAVLAAALAAGQVLAQAGVVTPEKLAYGKHLAQECTTCHRADGRGANIPPIVGLEHDYFVTTMKFYKTGARENPVMNSVAQMLNDEQLEALAAYLATQKPAPKPPPARKR